MEESNVIMNETNRVSHPVLHHRNTEIADLKKNIDALIKQNGLFSTQMHEINDNIKKILFKLEQFEVDELEPSEDLA